MPSPGADAPIGVFDSGVGGLTVFREINRALPHESLIYLGDSARVPYGTKSPATVVRYSLEAAHHLMQRGIKMLVVACNTATAAALPALKEELSIPVIGVVEPGARAAIERTRGRVGVIATEGTVKSHAYRKAIHTLDPKVEVIECAAPLFVPLAEEGWANTHVARQVAEIEAGLHEPMLRVGNLDSQRDITDVRDTVRAYRLIVKHGTPARPYNVCSGQAYRVRDLLDRLIGRSRTPIRVELDPERLRPSDNPIIAGDRSRIGSDTGWEPHIPIQQTLDDLLDYWRARTARR